MQSIYWVLKVNSLHDKFDFWFIEDILNKASWNNFDEHLEMKSFFMLKFLLCNIKS